MAGRPTKFNPKLGREICKKLANGESLRSICRSAKMPSRVSVHAWLIDGDMENPDPLKAAFLNQYVTATHIRADEKFDELDEIARNEKIDVARAKLITDVGKWSLGRMNPSKYGDRNTTDLNVKSNGAACDALQKITESYMKGGSSDTSGTKSN